MAIDIDFGYTTSAATDAVRLAKARLMVQEMFQWKKSKMNLEPEDVVNFMIDANLITRADAEQFFKESSLKVKLPTKHI